MRDHLLSLDRENNIITNLKSASTISLLVVLPLVILEYLNQTITMQNVPSLVALFGILWLLPVAFITIFLPMLQTVRERQKNLANLISLLLRVAIVGLIAMVWGGILIDQIPCFLGVPNCD